MLFLPRANARKFFEFFRRYGASVLGRTIWTNTWSPTIRFLFTSFQILVVGTALSYGMSAHAHISRIFLEAMARNGSGSALIERLAALSSDGRPMFTLMEELGPDLGRERFMELAHHVLNTSDERGVVRLRERLEWIEEGFFTADERRELAEIFYRTDAPTASSGARWEEEDFVRAMQIRSEAMDRYRGRSSRMFEGEGQQALQMLRFIRNPHTTADPARFRRGITDQQRALLQAGFDVFGKEERDAIRDPAVLEELVRSKGLSVDRDIGFFDPELVAKIRTGGISYGELQGRLTEEGMMRRRPILQRILRDHGQSYNALKPDLKAALGLTTEGGTHQLLQAIEGPALITLMETERSWLAGTMVKLPSQMMGGVVRALIARDPNITADTLIDMTAAWLSLAVAYAFEDENEGLEFLSNPRFMLDSLVVLTASGIFVGVVGSKAAYANRSAEANGSWFARMMSRYPSSIWDNGRLAGRFREIEGETRFARRMRWMREMGPQLAHQKTMTMVMGSGTFAVVTGGIGAMSEGIMRALEGGGWIDQRSVEDRMSYLEAFSYYGLYAGLSSHLRYQAVGGVMNLVRRIKHFPGFALSRGISLSPRVAVGLRDGLPYAVGLGVRYRNSQEGSDSLAPRTVEGDTPLERIGNWVHPANWIGLRGALLDYRQDLYDPTIEQFRRLFGRLPTAEDGAIDTVEQDLIDLCRRVREADSGLAGDAEIIRICGSGGE
jgi:hypothetical protein